MACSVLGMHGIACECMGAQGDPEQNWRCRTERGDSIAAGAAGGTSSAPTKCMCMGTWWGYSRDAELMEIMPQKSPGSNDVVDTPT